MSQTRLSYLLQRYFDNTATEEEVDELTLCIENKENEEEIKSVMDHIWKEQESTTPVFSPKKSESMLAGILKVHNINGPRPVEKRQKWWYAVAAAIILLIGSSVVFKLTIKKNTDQDIAKSPTEKTDAAPGTDRAVLTLSDRSTLVLDHAVNGELTRQGSTKIVKHNGQLDYVASKNETPHEILFNSITTPRGGQYQVTLSDGSKAWLNAASSLRFPAVFGSMERKVEMTGEVYFEVAKNSTKPFIVDVAGKGEVKVLGTHFNINAYSDEASVKTTLLEGSVKITSTNTRTSRIISPGEQVQLIANGQLSLKKSADMEQVMAWKNGRFDFSNADLPTVLRQLSRWYDVDIAFEGAIPARHFEGELQRTLKLSQVLRVLEKYDVHFKIEGKKLIILN